MASAIDPSKPVAGSPTTESVRLNFAAAKSEIELLQQTAGVGPQGPIGNTGPSGTLSVGTVTTGAAGTSAAVTNSGTAQAAVLNFTIPRGDDGTAGGGITETQAKDAVRQGNVKFLESPETTAVAFPTTPNAAGVPVVGDGWTPATGGTATQAYTHNIGDTEPLAYPASIASGTVYQVVFTMTNVAATSTALRDFFVIYFRNGPTNTSDQQIVQTGVIAGMTVTVAATGNFTHVVVVPLSGWQGTFTMTRVTGFTGAQNSVSLSIKDWPVRARANSLYLGGGGRLATGTYNIMLGSPRTGEVLTTGANNVAIGPNTFIHASSCSGNVAIGANAMVNVINGGNNVALGQNALNNLRGGSYNIAIGNNAVGETKSGSHNIGFGYYALGYENWGGDPTSSHNIAFGYYANHVPPFGSNNISIGQYAFAREANSRPPAPMTGSNNISIGNNAGRFREDTTDTHMTGAENSLFLGPNSRAQDSLQTNQIVIGFNAAGHGSNTITLGNDAVTALHCNVQTISALSDSRVKENIHAASLDQCVNAVRNLPVSEWDWLPIAGVHKNKHDIGFVSDDVAKVFPQAISKEDRHLTVRDAQGNPQMTSVTEAIWTPPDQPADPTAPRMQARQVEKTVEIKGLQYVSTAEILPTLWGAVQAILQKLDQLDSGKPQTDPPEEHAKESKKRKGHD